LYKEQRVTDLYLLTAYKNNGKESSLKTRMLDDRNESWVVTIKRQLRKTPVFLHLGPLI
jgi:hypothetical protein